MEQLPENNSVQGNPAATIAQHSLGAMLRSAREKIGLSVADVAAQTKFAPRQIEALEAEDFKSLPETVFLRGFVRSYAKILNLDAEVLLAAVPQTQLPATELIPASVEVPFPDQSSTQKNLLLLAAAVLITIIAIGFAVWHFTNPVKRTTTVKIETPVTLPAETQIVPIPAVPEQKETVPAAPEERKHKNLVTPEEPSVHVKKSESQQILLPVQPEDTVKSNSPAVESTAASGTEAITVVHKAASGKTISLRLVFAEESWAEITDNDGKIISSRIHAPGSEMNLHGHLPVTLVIGHAAATQLYENGEQVDLKPYTNSSSEVARITLK